MNSFRVKYVNAASTFVREPLVEEGTTIAALCTELDVDTSGVNLTVNNEQVPSSYALQPNDVISVTPRKVSGA